MKLVFVALPLEHFTTMSRSIINTNKIPNFTLQI